VESAFTFSFSPNRQLSQYHMPSASSKSFESLQRKNVPNRACKCVYEGKPRATNRSRVNPITVQSHRAAWERIVSTICDSANPTSRGRLRIR